MKLRTFAAMLAVVTLASVRPAGQTRPHSPTFPSTGTTAKSWTAPRTAWDDPDISGNFANLYEVGTPFERPEEFTGRQLGDVKGEELATIRRGIQERTRAEQLAGEIGGTRWIWLDSLDRHWEGGTLVVETTNFRERSVYRNANPDVLRLTERFTRVAPDKVRWAVTVDDGSTWTRPWTFAMPLTLNDKELMMPYECHEGNYAMTNILSGARAEEKTGRAGNASSDEER